MADFCVQCAEDLGFPGTDFPKREPYGWPEICEGCGPTFVDGDGKCVGECLRKHGKPDEPVEDDQ